MHPLEYLQQLRFAKILPEDVSITLDLETEASNTLLPPACQHFYQWVPQLKAINRMCSFPMMCLLGLLLQAVPRQIHYAKNKTLEPCFLNIGVWHGFSLLSSFLMAPDLPCIGVDNFSEFYDEYKDPRQIFLQHYEKFRQHPQHKFFEMDYRTYFKQHNQAIGVYFYDGPHTYADQLLGLELADPFLIPFAYVLVDDTNDPPAREATLAFVKKNPAYQILADIRTANNSHPTFWNGLMLLQKSPIAST